jgi:hypothetical protein
MPLLKGGTLERWKDSKLYQQLIGIIGEGSVDLNKVPAGVTAAVQKYHALLEEQRYLDYTTIIAEALAELKSNRTLRDKLATGRRSRLDRQKDQISSRHCI